MNTRETPTYYVYRGDYVPEPFGLHNPGMLCWCNTLIQFMLNIPSFNFVVLEHENILRDNPIAREYIRILKSTLAIDFDDAIEYHGATMEQLSGASAVIVQTIIDRMQTTGRSADLSFGQSCVDEAFTKIVELFDCSKLPLLFNSSYELVINCPGCHTVCSATRDTALRIEMFTDATIRTEQEFCAYIRSHPSEGDYYVCRCGHKMAKFTRMERLKMLREVVIVIFNKFQSPDKRWFPKKLRFRSVSGSYLNYDLISVVEHGGSQYGGHYWIHVRRGIQWYKINDSEVTQGSPEPTRNTYMICYHMIADTS